MFRRVNLALLLVTLVTASAGAANSIEPHRASELDNLVRQDCGSCHGLTMKGGLGPALLPANLAEADTSTLSDIILDGVPDTPMPPWRVEITPAEADWIVQRLKEGLD